MDYAGAGGGIKIGSDAEGFSLCGEIGLSLGAGVAVDPAEKGGEVSGSGLLDHVTDMLKEAIKGANTKRQAKLAARQCVQHKW